MFLYPKLELSGSNDLNLGENCPIWYSVTWLKLSERGTITEDHINKGRWVPEAQRGFPKFLGRLHSGQLFPPSDLAHNEENYMNLSINNKYFPIKIDFFFQTGRKPHNET